MHIYTYIYIYIYTNLAVNAIVRQPYPQRGYVYIYIIMYMSYTCIINPILHINIYIYISMYDMGYDTGNLQSPGTFKICVYLGKI